MSLAITFWFFFTYLGASWETPDRILDVYGPYGRDRCVDVQREFWLIEGSLGKSPCVPQRFKLTYQDLHP